MILLKHIKALTHKSQGLGIRGFVKIRKSPIIVRYVKLVSQAGRWFRKFLLNTKPTSGGCVEKESEGKSGEKIVLKSEAKSERFISSEYELGEEPDAIHLPLTLIGLSNLYY